MKKNQLDYVEKKGDTITARVLNGDVVSGRTADIEVSIMKTKEENRDFTMTNTVENKKIVFREVLMQMDEEWWDDLSNKLNASESKTSKVLGFLNNAIG